MHEGKHGILDGLEDMDELFGVEDDQEAEKEKEPKKKKSFLGFGKKQDKWLHRSSLNQNETAYR